LEGSGHHYDRNLPRVMNLGNHPLTVGNLAQYDGPGLSAKVRRFKFKGWWVEQDSNACDTLIERTQGWTGTLGE
jgi:hypothetical protein